MRRPVTLSRNVLALEDRTVPTVTWVGGHSAGRWSDGANWDGGQNPLQAGDSSIVFPDSGTNSYQDIPNLTVSSLVFMKGGNLIDLGADTTFSGGITSDAGGSTSPNTITGSAGKFGVGFGANVGANLDISVTTGELDISARMTAAPSPAGGTIDSGINKKGGGTLGLAGQNSYTGLTLVDGGTLVLDSPTSPSVPGSLFIGTIDDPTGLTVRCLQSGQIAGTDVRVLGGDLLDSTNCNQTIGNLTMGDATVQSGTGTITLNGDLDASQTASLATATITGNLALGPAATHTVTLGYALNLAANVSGPSGLTVVNGGRLTLSGNNSYTGPTVVNNPGDVTFPLALSGGVGGGSQGDKWVDVTGSQPSSPITLQDGYLGGTGTVGPITATGGAISPGLATATTPVVLNSGSVQLSGATYEPQTSADPNGVRDLQSVTGAVDVSGAKLHVHWIGGLASPGQVITLIANDGTDPVVGTFADWSTGDALPEGATVAVDNPPQKSDGSFQTFTLSYEGNDGNDVVLIAPKSPPPPPPATSFALGLANVLAGGPTDGTVEPFESVGNQLQSLGPPGSVFPGLTVNVRSAVADVNHDGDPDYIVVTGPGSQVMLTVRSGKDQSVLVAPFPVFEASFTGGAFVSAADLTGDGYADIVVTPDQGGGPVVAVYSGAQLAAGVTGDAAQVTRFLGIDDPNFRGGVRAAVGDVNGDGTPDLIVAAGFGGGPRVAGFDGKSVAAAAAVKMFPDFLAFEPGLRNGAYVAVGDVNGDGKADLIFGGGPTGAPRVRVVSGATLLSLIGVTTLDLALPAAQQAGLTLELADFFAGDPNSRGGVPVTAKDLDGDGRADLVTASGWGQAAQMMVYSGSNLLASGLSASGPSPNQTIALFSDDVLQNGVYVG